MTGFFGELNIVSFSICKSFCRAWFSFTREFPCVCSPVGTELLQKNLKLYQNNYLSRHIYLCLRGAKHLCKLPLALRLHYIYNHNLVFGCIYFESTY